MITTIISSIYVYSWLILITRKINTIRNIDKELLKRCDLQTKIMIDHFPNLVTLAKIIATLTLICTAPISLIHSAMDNETIERSEYIDKIQNKE